MSSTERALYQAILKEPGEDLHRLVYADWLEEEGQLARAEFIRTQVSLAQAADCGHRVLEEGCERCALTRAEEVLLEEHGDEWLASLPGSGWKWDRHTEWRNRPIMDAAGARLACFRRGFVSFIVLSTDDFCADAHLLINGHPIERVQLADRWPRAEHIGGYSWRDGHVDFPNLVPWFLVRFLSEGTLPSGCWETEHEALLALSDACLEGGREYANKLGAKQVYTTGQVAKVLQVAPRTVVRWFDTGKLGGYRIPGSQDRRIPRDKLVPFIREHGFFEPPPRPANPLPAPAPFSHETYAEQRQAFIESVRNQDTFTTGEIARLVQVAPRTVVKWIDAGKLPAHRSASGKHRLVARADLTRFLQENGMPLEGWEEAEVPAQG
jgi:uncharacterized protein (TIGR02996 family)/excisionase family DNA binding protein